MRFLYYFLFAVAARGSAKIGGDSLELIVRDFVRMKALAAVGVEEDTDSISQRVKRLGLSDGHTAQIISRIGVECGNTEVLSDIVPVADLLSAVCAQGEEGEFQKTLLASELVSLGYDSGADSWRDSPVSASSVGKATSPHMETTVFDVRGNMSGGSARAKTAHQSLPSELNIPVGRAPLTNDRAERKAEESNVLANSFGNDFATTYEGKLEFAVREYLRIRDWDTLINDSKTDKKEIAKLSRNRADLKKDVKELNIKDTTLWNEESRGDKIARIVALLPSGISSHAKRGIAGDFINFIGTL